jgi:hypothetical protein
MAGLFGLGALPVVGGTLDGIVGGLVPGGGLGSVLDPVTGIVTGVLPGGALGNVLDPVTGLVGGAVSGVVLEPVKGAVGDMAGLLDPVTGLVGGVAGSVTPALSGALGQILGSDSALGGLLGSVGGGAGNLMSGLGSSLASLGDGLGDLLGGGNGGKGGGGTGGITTIVINGGTSITGTPGNDFLQGGAGNDKLYGGAGDDILDGAGGFDIGIYQGDHTAYTVSATGGALTVKDSLATRDGTDTLRNMEFLQFRDGGIDLATNTFVPQEILNQSATAYRGVIRLDAPTGVAETIGSGIVQGKFSFDTYVDALIKASDHSTVPALLVAGVVTGTIPTSEKLDALSAFAQSQYDYYANVLGSASPQLGPYEALGRAFGSTSEFQARYASGTDVGFVSQAYQDIFGSPASSAAHAALSTQLSYFEALYKGSGYSEQQAEVQARGAVFGQILGYAASDANESYHDSASVVLTGFANGDTASYGAAFG